MTRVAAAIALILVQAACASRSDDSLVFSIQQALATTSGAVAMADVVPDTWDLLCVFTRNAASTQIDSVTSSVVRDPDRAVPADYSLLAFLSRGDLEHRVAYPIDKGEFAAPGPEPWYCLSREAAVFEMRAPIDGSIPWIGPVRPE